MKTFKDITLEQRTQIGNYYKDGMKATAIAPLYGTDAKTVYNIVSYLREHGMVIPAKLVVKKRVKAQPKELLVLPDEPKKENLTRTSWSDSKKKQAYYLYKKENVTSVMKEFNINESKAYYLIQEGRKLLHPFKKTRTRTVVAKPATEKNIGLGWFFLGVMVGAFVVAIM